MCELKYKKSESQLSIKIEHSADIAYSVIMTREFCEKLNFDRNEQSLIATAVSELTTNIVRYADSGHVFYHKITDGRRTGILIVVQDDGPGIDDISAAVAPEYSTGDSLGLGLSSVKEIMDSLEIESGTGRGTRITVTKWRI